MTESNMGKLLTDGIIMVDEAGCGWLRAQDVRDAYILDVDGKIKPYSDSEVRYKSSLLEDLQQHNRLYRESAAQFREERDKARSALERTGEQLQAARLELDRLHAAKYEPHKLVDGASSVYGPSKEEHLATQAEAHALRQGVLALIESMNVGNVRDLLEAQACLRGLVAVPEGLRDLVTRMELGINDPDYKASHLLDDLKKMRALLPAEPT